MPFNALWRNVQAHAGQDETAGVGAPVHAVAALDRFDGGGLEGGLRVAEKGEEA